MTPEQKFWQLLRPRLLGHVCRIENSIASGMPDVNIAYNGRETWIELKAGSKIRDTQKVWHRQRTLQGSRVLVIERDEDVITVHIALNSLGLYRILWSGEKPWNWASLVATISGEY